ncbi:MAG: aminotransferase class I/II-fold pyridoxal phosphate-dependent enzyme [Lachnospiraceae bacterium]|nr:aminotransferase class I/II-fold pyridoxal phosphate-dependent enzyme [Lachnospiraceae bacterium]
MDNLSKRLKEYSKNGAYPFHMPGHKRQLEGAYRYDITEIEGFDNLNNPTGIIREMNEKIAKIYESKASFFTVNGSTCGNLSAISAVTDFGDTIIVARNCHKSVTNVAYIRKLNIEYAVPDMANRTLIGPISLEEIKSSVSNLSTKGIVPKAVVLTSPTYEGFVSDIPKIADYLHSKKIPLIVDSAHGAHLHFDDTFPSDHIDKIDICIMSAHKTLPVLNQGAIVHVNSDLVDAENVMKFLRIYQTSSPSYVIMESMSYALEIIAKKNRFSRYISNLRRFYKEISPLKALSVEPEADNRDFGKIVIYTNGYMSGEELCNRLRSEYNLELEMYNDAYALAMTSIMDKDEAFDELAHALLEIDEAVATDIKLQNSGESDDKDSLIGGSGINISHKEKTPSASYFLRRHAKKCESYEISGKCVYLPIDECEGKVAGDAIIAYPPGIAIIMPGEVIDRQDIDYIKENPNHIEGLYDGKMCIWPRDN